MSNSTSDPRTSGLSMPQPLAPGKYRPATLGVHADDPINQTNDVAPSLHVSTTFRFASNPDDLVVAGAEPWPSRAAGTIAPADSHIYSRESAPNTSRLETLLTALLGGPSLTYSSGLAAFHALLTHLNPRVVAIGAGYHGCHGVLKIFQKLTGCKIIDLFGSDADWDAAGLGKGDVVHVETPVNPLGIAYDLASFAARAHARGAKVTVDATFAPPPLQDPFASGADYIMHSGTKYFGGHSDMLCGVLTVRRGMEGWEEAYWELYEERVYLGSVMGSMEGWLGVRSLRTFELRIVRQSENCAKLVSALDACLRGDGYEGVTEADAQAVRAVVAKVEHASLQHDDMSWLKKQMPGGFGPVFSFTCRDEQFARRLPSRLHLFHHATSLGGVESLIEWRRMSDQTVDPRLCRVSVGVEDWRDLLDDLLMGVREIASKK